MADLRVPPLGESITEAVVGRWLKNVGDAVASGEPVVELETDKITVQIPAPEAGALSERLVAEGATVKVDDLIGRVSAGAVAAAAPAPVAAAAAPAAVAAPVAVPAPIPVAAPVAAAAPAPIAPASTLPKDALLRLSPAARAAARESGVLPSPASAPAVAPSAPAAAPVLVTRPGDEVVAMSPLRKRIAERLVQAQHEAAMLTTFNEVDMSAVMALRAKYQDDFVKKNGLKLGFMSFFTKAVVNALKEIPAINAQFAGDEIIQNHYFDIGVAVSTEKGLMVPVIRNADQLGMADIEKAIGDAAKRARDGKITLADLEGGVFTITNGGIFGSMLSTPILNAPQSAILGLHAITERPVAVNGQVVIRPMMYLALSYDHRLVDGREAVTFLVKVKQAIEDPARLLLAI